MTVHGRRERVRQEKLNECVEVTINASSTLESDFIKGIPHLERSYKSLLESMDKYRTDEELKMVRVNVLQKHIKAV